MITEQHVVSFNCPGDILSSTQLFPNWLNWCWIKVTPSLLLILHLHPPPPPPLLSTDFSSSPPLGLLLLLLLSFGFLIKSPQQNMIIHFSLSRSSRQDVQEFIAARIISQSVSIKTRLSTKVCVRRNNRRTETEAEPSDCDLQLTFTWHTPIDPDQYSLHSHYVPLTVSLWWCELLNHSQVVWRLHPLWQSDSCSL